MPRARFALLDGAAALRRQAAKQMLWLRLIPPATTPGGESGMTNMTQYSPLLALAIAAAILFFCISLTLMGG